MEAKVEAEEGEAGTTAEGLVTRPPKAIEDAVVAVGLPKLKGVAETGSPNDSEEGGTDVGLPNEKGATDEEAEMGSSNEIEEEGDPMTAVAVRADESSPKLICDWRGAGEDAKEESPNARDEGRAEGEEAEKPPNEKEASVPIVAGGACVSAPIIEPNPI